MMVILNSIFCLGYNTQKKILKQLIKKKYPYPHAKSNKIKAQVQNNNLHYYSET